MIRQENCPLCDWKIEWDKVKREGNNNLCPKCNTRLVGEMKKCKVCGKTSPIDAFFCLHCKKSFPSESVPGFMEMMSGE